MKKFRTIVSVIVMCLAGIVGLFFGGVLDEAMGGAILFSMIAGIACVVYAIENRAMSSLAIAVAGLLTVVGASVFAQFM